MAVTLVITDAGPGFTDPSGLSAALTRIGSVLFGPVTCIVDVTGVVEVANVSVKLTSMAPVHCPMLQKLRLAVSVNASGKGPLICTVAGGLPHPSPQEAMLLRSEATLI